MSKWTPEPWDTDQLEGHVFGGPIDRLVANCMGRTESHDESCRDQNVANAARIVACVNALAGLNPEAVGEAVEFVRRVARVPCVGGCYDKSPCEPCAARAALAKLETKP